MKFNNYTDLVGHLHARAAELVATGVETRVSKATELAYAELVAEHQIDAGDILEQMAKRDATKQTRREIEGFIDPPDDEPVNETLPGILPPISKLVRIADDEYKPGMEATPVEHADHGEHYEYKHSRRARYWKSYKKSHHVTAGEMEEEGFDPTTTTYEVYVDKKRAEAGDDIDSDDDEAA